MDTTCDPAKNTRNIELRGLSFECVADFEFETALFSPDVLRDDGEVRIRALGRLKGRLHALVFTETADDIRVISFRKANKREERIDETQLT
jgi:uncharacterized DUF497 family protein